MNTKDTFLKSAVNALFKARERAAQRRIREHLRGLSDRHLEDMGLSRALLEQGPTAWPWRVPGELDGRLRPVDGEAHHAAQPIQFDLFEADEKLAA